MRRREKQFLPDSSILVIVKWRRKATKWFGPRNLSISSCPTSTSRTGTRLVSRWAVCTVYSTSTSIISVWKRWWSAWCSARSTKERSSWFVNWWRIATASMDGRWSKSWNARQRRRESCWRRFTRRFRTRNAIICGEWRDGEWIVVWTCCRNRKGRECGSIGLLFVWNWKWYWRKERIGKWNWGGRSERQWIEWIEWIEWMNWMKCSELNE